MNKEFNKTVFFDNIAYLLKEEGMKVGELEAEAGVSPGYISRTSKEGNAKPGIDFIARVSGAFNVSIDLLISTEISAITPTARYVMAFLGKLLRDTLADKLTWNRESVDYLNNEIHEELQGSCNHPLFFMKQYVEEFDCEYEEINEPVFESRAFGIRTVVEGDWFNLSLKDGATLYITNIRRRVCRVADPEAYAKEIWLCSANREIQYLCNTKDIPEISELIEELYMAVTENEKHPKLNKDFKGLIDAFMEDDPFLMDFE